MHSPTKIDDTLGFLEPKRAVRCMSGDVIDW